MVLSALGIMAMLWAVGGYLKWPKSMVWSLIALAYLAVLGLQLALPQGDATPLAMLGGAGVLVGIYVLGLAKLKSRVPKADEPAPQGTFREAELERYARHIVLRELGGPGQKRLKQARVLVIGAGGLGSPVLMYLAAAGVGTIGVIDDDFVEHTNMQRQVIHREDTMDMPKVQSAVKAMAALNPFISLRPYQRRLTEEIAQELFSDYDVIIDGTDNFETRYLANRVAVRLGKPLVSGALAQWEGQLSVFDPAKGGPCYQCVFPEKPAAGLAPSCAEAGVIGPLPGVIGTMMALETVKLIAGAGHVTRGEMLIYDGLYGESRKIKLAQRSDCPICGALT